MASNPLNNGFQCEGDENFYDTSPLYSGLKNDSFDSDLKSLNSFCSGYSLGSNAMSNYSDQSNLSPWPISFNSSIGPENDHTYNISENRLSSSLPAYGSARHMSLFNYTSYDDHHLKFEDDVFQVDKNDLIQDPTLAELNSDSSLYDIDPFEFQDIHLPGEEQSSAILRSELTCKSERNYEAKICNFMKKCDEMNIGTPEVTRYTPDVNCNRLTAINTLGLVKCEDEVETSDNMIIPIPSRRIKRESESSTSQLDGSWNGESNEEGSDSDSDGTDHEVLDDIRFQDKFKNQDKYFWQYNVQAKGPKNKHKVTLSTSLEDPHFLDTITDPVFNPECQTLVQGIKHTGKARKGDGNDLNPCPKKLHSIGKELKKLNRIINDISSVDGQSSARSDCRKEKNKLASRVCRLKKKAQHEANKLKLHALQDEHRRYMECIARMKRMFFTRVQMPNNDKSTTEELLEIATPISSQSSIAGRTTEYINEILENISKGIPEGGLSMR